MKQNIIPKNELNAVMEICRAAQAKGGKAFLVGGRIRDAFFNVPGKDIDIEIFGLDFSDVVDFLQKRFSVDTIGKSFSVLKIRSTDIDVSLPRKEKKTGLGHKEFSVIADPNLTYEEACSRRDFTVNAILYDPIEDQIHDPFNGMQDLQDRRLRHVSGKFSEDPLRVLRAMQFIARFDLIPETGTLELCRSIEEEGLACERIFEEWTKLILKGKNIAAGLQFLFDCGWIRYYPELERLNSCPQEPAWHPEGNVWEHTKLCMNAYVKDKSEDTTDNLIVGLATLCHDLGKPGTTKNDRGRIRSPGHDHAGVAPTRSFLAKLSNRRKLVEEVVPLVRWHMVPYQLYEQNSSEAAIRRLANKVKRMDRLIRVNLADHNGRGKPYRSKIKGIEWLKEQTENLNITNSSPQPIILGRDLLNLGMRANPIFGEILSLCFEAQLSGKFKEHPEGVKYLMKLVDFQYKKYLEPH